MTASRGFRTTRLRTAPVLVAFAAVAVALSVATIQARSATPPVVDPNARALLEQARAAITFELQQPTWLPDDYQLARVIWIAPDPALGTTRSSVDTWFYDGSGNMVHVWQSDIDPAELGDKDPVAVGRPTTIDNQVWSRLDGHLEFDGKSLTVLSARLSDGTIMSIDTPGGFDVLARVAGSMEPRGLRDPVLPVPTVPTP